ncbi:46 kDa FK506-binding nuclear protein isoform X1 [Aricia agestis]|uniref:46 kDa FK506-binding nuclear protein isoform X1 n=1 Tax=Aricia agestis TaxID=91739 RepID=UPI001C20C3E0|nr:46 kDa FK506-binding nuclear protein isoform X1 [Aricia agestis]XP_041980403.1 46 kDa FK506-binding nuclear protein isoform X1 [Aricia agestis]
MFWGLITEPNKRYTQVVEKPFHISQAAMDISTGDNDPCQVMVVVEGKNYLVCTLQKNKCIQVPLDLYFKTGDSVSFLTNGKCNVHLTGYLDPEFEDEPSEEEDSAEEEEEEEEESPPAKNKRKLDNSNEVSASKKAKKALKKAEDSSDDSDEDGEDQLQKFLDGEDIDTDENDDSFKVNTSLEEDSDEESDVEEEAEDEEEDEDDDDSDKADTSMDTSKEETVDMSKLTKSQKKRLKKKQKEQQKQQQQPQTNGIAKKEKPADKAEKKKEKKQEQKKDVEGGDKKEKKSLSGGVFIEDLKVGAGPAAKPGKTVMVYYEGRLKQNNKMFDNCLKGPGFKFKLGAKEVISGWDIGVAGMKVGGKRKIICPPAMAYGAKGSPPVIPPNSTLVFEVELKNVK